MSQSSPTACPVCGAALEIVGDGEVASHLPLSSMRLRSLKEVVKMTETDLSLEDKAKKIKEATEKLADHVLQHPLPEEIP